MCISFVGLALNREPPSPLVKEHVSTRHYFRRLPGVLRANANYRRFFISRTVVILGTMANSFFIIYGSQRFALDGAAIGALTAALVASQAVMSLVWGVVGDRAGHKAGAGERRRSAGAGQPQHAAGAKPESGCS